MEKYKEILSQQVCASVDTLKNAIEHCPEDLWDNGNNFWYLAYHTLFFLDYYTEEEPTKYHPPAPFTMSEMNPEGEMPDRTYTKAELLNFLAQIRNKIRGKILSLTETSAFQPVITYNKEYPVLEILLFNMRHVQHHSAQLNLLIRQHGAEAPGWVSRA